MDQSPYRPGLHVSDVLIVTQSIIGETLEVATATNNVFDVVTQGPQGPQGPAGPTGPPGASTDPDLYFQVSNRFYEIAEDETAKQDARQNLGLAVIDGGTFN